MATTKLWHIKGRLKDLVAYVENPEKTMVEKPDLQPLWDVLSYVQRPAATNPPYGYRKGPESTKQNVQWIVDETAAETVRQIFAWCVEGLGPTQIAKRLKAAKVMTPREH